MPADLNRIADLLRRQRTVGVDRNGRIIDRSSNDESQNPNHRGNVVPIREGQDYTVLKPHRFAV